MKFQKWHMVNGQVLHFPNVLTLSRPGFLEFSGPGEASRPAANISRTVGPIDLKLRKMILRHNDFKMTSLVFDDVITVLRNLMTSSSCLKTLNCHQNRLKIAFFILFSIFILKLSIFSESIKKIPNLPYFRFLIFLSFFTEIFLKNGKLQIRIFSIYS